MNWRAITTIIRKDLKVVLQSRAVLIPLIIVPLVILIIMPGIGGVLLSGLDETSPELAELRSEMGGFFDNLPPEITAEFEQFETEPQRLVYLLFVYMFSPLYLILPVMVANVIAADSFVGEKERKTLEALIYTPTTERELYTAKLLSPWLAGIVISLVGFVAYGIVINLTTWPLMGRIFFPNLTWILLAVWVAPAAAGLGLGAMVLVSSRVSTFQEAYQLGGLIVLPIVLLVIGQAAGVIYFNVAMVLLLGLILWIIDFAIFWYGARTFSREALITRL